MGLTIAAKSRVSVAIDLPDLIPKATSSCVSLLCFHRRTIKGSGRPMRPASVTLLCPGFLRWRRRQQIFRE